MSMQKFIKLIFKDQSTEVKCIYLDGYDISIMQRYAHHTYILLKSYASMEVMETPDEIMKLIQPQCAPSDNVEPLKI